MKVGMQRMKLRKTSRKFFQSDFLVKEIVLWLPRFIFTVGNLVSSAINLINTSLLLSELKVENAKRGFVDNKISLKLLLNLSCRELEKDRKYHHKINMYVCICKQVMMTLE
jgi:hypothetical protein